MRQPCEAGTQTPPSVRDFRQSLIDYSNRLFSSAGADEIPLSTVTPKVQSSSFGDENKEDQDELAAGAAAAGGKSSTNKASRLTSSFLARGRNVASSSGKKVLAAQTAKAKTQNGDVKSSRGGIFVLLGLAPD